MNTPSEREASPVEPVLEVGRDASSEAPGSDTMELRDVRETEPRATDASPHTFQSLSDQDLGDMDDPSEQVADQELVTDSDADDDDFGDSMDEPTVVAALPTSMASDDDEPALATDVEAAALGNVEASEAALSDVEASDIEASEGALSDVEASDIEASEGALSDVEASDIEASEGALSDVEASGAAPSDVEASDAAPPESEIEAVVEGEATPESEPAPERLTMPDSIVAKRRDDPLPSFDIPDVESAPLEPAPVGAKPAAAAQTWAAYEAAEVEMPPLNELTEDEDDAVTSIEVQASDVGDLTPAPRAFEPAGFTPAPVAVAPVAAVAAATAAMPRLDHRKAATVLIRRVDVPERPGAPATPSAPPGPPWWANAVDWLRRRRLPRFSDATREHASLRKVGRFFDAIVPELSLVLFGSGIGAASVLFVTRGSDVAEPAQTQAVQPLRVEQGRSGAKPAGELTLTERARAGDRDALANISHLAANERSSQLTLAQEEGEGVQSAQDWRVFIDGLKSEATNEGLSKRFLAFATNPATMLDAFRELTEWPGAKGPDLIYSVWEGSPGGHRASGLARSLLYTADQRAKASPALEAALELRESQSCEDFARALPQVLAHGDSRSLDMLVALKHANACGVDNQQDCYACLRGDSLLEESISAVKQRPGPEL